jgi:uncharacterized protein
MEFEWDEDKRLANIKNNGIDFIDVSEVFDGDIFTVEDDSRSGRRCQRYSYGEQRFVTFGPAPKCGPEVRIILLLLKD